MNLGVNSSRTMATVMVMKVKKTLAKILTRMQTQGMQTGIKKTWKH